MPNKDLWVLPHFILHVEDVRGELVPALLLHDLLPIFNGLSLTLFILNPFTIFFRQNLLRKNRNVAKFSFGMRTCNDRNLTKRRIENALPMCPFFKAIVDHPR